MQKHYIQSQKEEPYAGAKKVGIFITTHIDYSKELITKEIEKKLTIQKEEEISMSKKFQRSLLKNLFRSKTKKI
jgi:hypothetical protein